MEMEKGFFWLKLTLFPWKVEVETTSRAERSGRSDGQIEKDSHYGPAADARPFGTRAGEGGEIVKKKNHTPA